MKFYKILSAMNEREGIKGKIKIISRDTYNI